MKYWRCEGKILDTLVDASGDGVVGMHSINSTILKMLDKIITLVYSIECIVLIVSS